MKRGVSFLIPNKYSSPIYEVLHPANFSLYNWHIDGDEVYLIKDSEFDGEALFKQQIIDGSDFAHIVKDNTYYMILAELKAFRKDTTITEITSYSDFISSNCEVIMLVADCSYVDIYCKDNELIEKIYENAKLQGYKDLEYIDENDTRTRMYVN